MFREELLTNDVWVKCRTPEEALQFITWMANQEESPWDVIPDTEFKARWKSNHSEVFYNASRGEFGLRPITHITYAEALEEENKQPKLQAMDVVNIGNSQYVVLPDVEGILDLYTFRGYSRTGPLDLNSIEAIHRKRRMFNYSELFHERAISESFEVVWSNTELFSLRKELQELSTEFTSKKEELEAKIRNLL